MATVEGMFQRAIARWTSRVQEIHSPMPSHLAISLHMELSEFFSDWQRRRVTLERHWWRNLNVYALLEEAQEHVVAAFIAQNFRQ